MGAGESTVVFRYEPSAWRLGLAVALFAVLALLAWGLWPSYGPHLLRTVRKTRPMNGSAPPADESRHDASFLRS